MHPPEIKTIPTIVHMPILDLPAKTTLVHTSKGVVMISPGPGSDVYPDAAKSMGRVTSIVAPNLFHHMGLKKAAQLFPEADIWAVKGLKEKNSTLPIAHTLGKDSWGHDKELAHVEILGMPSFNESVFIHKASKTLICTDLCFNHIHGEGFGTWLMFNIFGTYRKFAVSRLFKFFIKEKHVMAESLKTLFSHDFDNIIMAHGVDVFGDAKEKLTAALNHRGIYF